VQFGPGGHGAGSTHGDREIPDILELEVELPETHKQFSSPHAFGISVLQYLKVPSGQFKTVGEQLDLLLELDEEDPGVQGP
jgi:hypothetical protein